MTNPIHYSANCKGHHSTSCCKAEEQTDETLNNYLALTHYLALTPLEDEDTEEEFSCWWWDTAQNKKDAGKEDVPSFPALSSERHLDSVDPMGKLAECMDRSALSRSLVETLCHSTSLECYEKKKNPGQRHQKTKVSALRRKESTRKHVISQPLKSAGLLHNETSRPRFAFDENCRPSSDKGQKEATGTNFRLTGLKSSSNENLMRLDAKLKMLKSSSASKKKQVIPLVQNDKFRLDFDVHFTL
jgi:hypothetical protein